jgi:DNA-binding response OmpR family regulator
MNSELVATPQVAVVDDDPRIRALLDAELSDAGVEPHLCASGMDLLELVQRQSIDLILLDLMMPELDGLQCLIKLREIGYSGNVLIVTALSDDSKKSQALQAGAKDYILKPDLFDALPHLIDQYLRVKQEPRND